MVFGVIGLWGVFASNARAARLYLWTRAANFLVGLAVSLLSGDGWTTFFTTWGLAWLYFSLYYIKASTATTELHREYAQKVEKRDIYR